MFTRANTALLYFYMNGNRNSCNSVFCLKLFTNHFNICDSTSWSSTDIRFWLELKSTGFFFNGYFGNQLSFFMLVNFFFQLLSLVFMSTEYLPHLFTLHLFSEFFALPLLYFCIFWKASRCFYVLLSARFILYIQFYYSPFSHSLSISEVFWGHWRRSTLEPFCKISYRLKVGKCFREKSPSQMFNRVLNTFLYWLIVF